MLEQIPCLTHDYVFCCRCEVTDEAVTVGLLVLNFGFESGEYTLWDSQNRLYTVEVEGQPGTSTPGVTLKRINAAV